MNKKIDPWWLFLILGSILFPLGGYFFWGAFHTSPSDSGYGLALMLGLIVTLISLGLFSISAFFLNFKGATIYKIILLVTIVLLILLIAGGGI